MLSTMWTVPNLITLSRLALLLPICWLMGGGWSAHAFAFVLYAGAALSDWLDGWWARTYNQGSDFGRMLDPVVDKIFIAGIFIMLSAPSNLHPGGTLSGIWLFCPIIILAREFLVAGLREYLGPRGLSLPVTKLAKWKTTTQMIALGLLIFPGMEEPGLFVLLIATVLTVITGVHYLKRAGL